MNINCEVKLITCDIDQFYIIKDINLNGSSAGYNLSEIYNLQLLVKLCAECIIINSKIKFLRSLKIFNNKIQIPSRINNVIIGNLTALETLCSMNVSFEYGYLPYYIQPPKTARCRMLESSIFPWHCVCRGFS